MKDVTRLAADLAGLLRVLLSQFAALPVSDLSPSSSFSSDTSK